MLELNLASIPKMLHNSATQRQSLQNPLQSNYALESMKIMHFLQDCLNPEHTQKYHFKYQLQILTVAMGLKMTREPRSMHQLQLKINISISW